MNTTPPPLGWHGTLSTTLARQWHAAFQNDHDVEIYLLFGTREDDRPPMALLQSLTHLSPGEEHPLVTRAMELWAEPLHSTEPEVRDLEVFGVNYRAVITTSKPVDPELLKSLTDSVLRLLYQGSPEEPFLAR